MRKPELAAAIAEKADLTKDQASRVLNAVLEEITGALNRKDSVTLVGFGTLSVARRRPRTIRNPRTGQPASIGGRALRHGRRRRVGRSAGRRCLRCDARDQRPAAW